MSISWRGGKILERKMYENTRLCRIFFNQITDFKNAHFFFNNQVGHFHCFDSLVYELKFCKLHHREDTYVFIKMPTITVYRPRNF